MTLERDHLHFEVTKNNGGQIIIWPDSTNEVREYLVSMTFDGKLIIKNPYSEDQSAITIEKDGTSIIIDFAPI